MGQVIPNQAGTRYVMTNEQPKQNGKRLDEADVPRTIPRGSSNPLYLDQDGYTTWSTPASHYQLVSAATNRHRGSRKVELQSNEWKSEATSRRIIEAKHLSRRYYQVTSEDEFSELFIHHQDDMKMQVLSTFIAWYASTVFPDLLQAFQNLHPICYGGCDQGSDGTSADWQTPYAGTGSQATKSDPNHKGRKRGREGGGFGLDADKSPSLCVEIKDQRKRQKVVAFACHFHKFNPTKFSSGKYKTCPNAYDGLNRLKQHQKYVHRPSYYCKRCKTVFKTQDEKDVHDGQLRRCPERHDADFDALLTTDKQREVLGKKSPNTKVTEEDHWYEMWDIFFEGHPRPSSPYKDYIADGVFEFVSFAESRTEEVVESFCDTYRGVDVDITTLGLFYQFAIRENLDLFTSQTASLQQMSQNLPTRSFQQTPIAVENEFVHMSKVSPTVNKFTNADTSPSSGASGPLPMLDIPPYCLDPPLFVKPSQQDWQYQGSEDRLQPQGYIPKDDDYSMHEQLESDLSAPLLSFPEFSSDGMDTAASWYGLPHAP